MKGPVRSNNFVCGLYVFLSLNFLSQKILWYNAQSLSISTVAFTQIGELELLENYLITKRSLLSHVWNNKEIMSGQQLTKIMNFDQNILLNKEQKCHVRASLWRLHLNMIKTTKHRHLNKKQHSCNTGDAAFRWSRSNWVNNTSKSLLY